MLMTVFAQQKVIQRQRNQNLPMTVFDETFLSVSKVKIDSSDWLSSQATLGYRLVFLFISIAFLHENVE